ncbi:unknown similar to AMEV086 [Choristoneura rosaceana entomopoxvirus 'L']|uniref:Uncharacterized protein n=1 Tax=Choristoneura rosaceana entomopoxvirus 'L' TaxID=1293539 RepID=A0ABM9QKF5_9POXV|nr:unknown similar to AMEV086 [Choristoneura rosaceana entomopoxvirus 'L']CCU56013.1 unknown similar to AMEV086 [Choristoneura rosaceana entomopoxvirus 'L']
METKKDLIITSLIISKYLTKKDLNIEYSNLYTEVLLRQKNGSLIEALRPNHNFFERYNIEAIKDSGIENKPMVITSHLNEDGLNKIKEYNK